jgi:hypothetical protein
MIFSKENAGKWVASKNDKVIATSKKLTVLIKKVEARKDKDSIRFDIVPPHSIFAGAHAISVR